MTTKANENLDDIDRKLLNRMQSDFPITRYPYRELATELNLTEDEVLTRVRDLKQHGIIRRIGGNFSPEKVGFVSTLCAAKVPEDQIDAFASVVNQFTGVTHNYVRQGQYNVWFTFIAPSMDIIEQNLAQIASLTGIDNILNLPATRVFKIKAHFNL